jgi:parallel beta-helix repeat protein
VKISKYLNISIFVILFVSVFLLTPHNVEAVATTRTVCPNPVGACSPSDPSFVGADGIVAAITASSDGDTVSIKNGTYSGFSINQQGDYNYFIILTKNLTITGESTNGTILSGAGANKASIFLVNNTGNSTISNLTISGFQVITCPATPCSYGVGVEVAQTGSGTLSLSNLKIIGDSDINIDDTGIWIYGSSKVTITNSSIYSSNSGVELQGTSNLNITSSTIYSNDDGILYRENTTGTISSTTVRNNTADGVTITDSAVVAVNNNLIYSNTRVGLRLWETSQTTGTGNTIYSNLYTGHASGVYCTQSAVLGTWTNNNVWNNANGNYGSIPPELCPNKTGTNGNISVDPQSLLTTSSSSSSNSLLPETALGEDSFLKIFISFLAICIGIIFLSRHFATISKEDN